MTRRCSAAAQPVTVTYSFTVGSGKQFLAVNTGWPGGDVPLTRVSPSGTRYARGADGTGVGAVRRTTGPTFESVVVPNPGRGTWTAEMFGLDVNPQGEPVTLDTYEAEPDNAKPDARFSTRVSGDRLQLDGSSSTDPDGTVTEWAWYIGDADNDQVLTGATVNVPLRPAKERTITLVVTDNGKGTGFADVTNLLVDVMPGSQTNPVKTSQQASCPPPSCPAPISMPPRSMALPSGSDRPHRPAPPPGKTSTATGASTSCCTSRHKGRACVRATHSCA